MSRRHLARSIILQSLFEWDFYNHEKDLVEIIERNFKEFGPGLNREAFLWRIANGVVEHLEEIDEMIRKAAPDWPLEKIAPVDRNALRIGFYELLHEDRSEVPAAVAINEAIELAKNFGGPNSGKFVNGVLGTVHAKMQKEKKKKQ